MEIDEWSLRHGPERMAGVRVASMPVRYNLTNEVGIAIDILSASVSNIHVMRPADDRFRVLTIDVPLRGHSHFVYLAAEDDYSSARLIVGTLPTGTDEQRRVLVM